MLRPGGTLLVQDQCLPENPAAARYINRFERLRDPSHRRSLSASEWEANFHRAGLSVAHQEIIDKKHNFETWVELQDCSQRVKVELVKMLKEAPEEALAWMRPSGFGSPQAAFYNHHILIAGRKL